MRNKVTAINEAEGIFYPAFDKHLCDDSQMTAEGGEKQRLWDSLTFRGGKHMTFCWNGETELGEYDCFLGFLTIPPGSSLSGSAVVNGKEISLFHQVPGADAPIEVMGKLEKEASGKEASNQNPNQRLLTGLRLEYESDLEQNVIVLSWFGLVKTARLKDIEKRSPVWQPEWDSLVITGQWGHIKNNLVLSEEEGKKLKRQINQNAYSREAVRNRAEEGMKVIPEEIIGEYAPVMPHMYRFVRVRDRGRAVPEGPLLDLAVAGYLLEEPAYSLQAARLILALLPMKWFEGPVCEMEGSEFHHVCFTEDHLLSQVCLAVGFLGNVLTEKAMERILEKIEKEWRFITGKCMEPGYRNFMNQGVVGNRGAMLGAAFLQIWKGGLETEMDACYKRHSHVIENYLTEDGHCAEGAHYFEYSFSTSILLWHVYAGMKKVPVSEIVPERFKRSGRYLAAMMSAGDHEGRKNPPVNCGSGLPAMTLLVIFMTMVCDFPEGNNYLAARFSGGEKEKVSSAFDLLFYLYYKEAVKLTPYYRPEREEISYPKEGLLTYRDGASKLTVTAERNPLTAHFHEDRGGVILEADGEILLPDLGTTSYSNPFSLVMDKQAYHNLACPADMTMVVESQTGMNAAADAAFPIKKELTLKEMEIPEAKVLYHWTENGRYFFGVETGMLFGEGIQGVREGMMTENLLKLTDSWRFPESHKLQVTYLSYHPWEISREWGEAVSGRMKICVHADNDWKFRTETGMIDFNEKEVYVLRIETEASTNHQVESVITWDALEPSPEYTGKENRIAFQRLLDKAGTIRIETPGVYEVEDTLIIKSHTRLIFGAGVYLKRASSSAGSFFMMNEGALKREYDTDITIEGLHLITNGVEARHNAAVYGLTGELSFFYIKRLRIFDFECLDLPRLSFGIHVCTFEDLVIERIHVEGRKDAVHLGKGNKFVIRHGLFRTFDDPIALNAHDYAVANPQMGWIEDGLIEDCYDLDEDETTGYFCRILAGAWVDWYEGMEIQNSDTVVHNGRVYRAFQEPDGTFYKSVTPPVHTEGRVTLDGINWVMVQEEVTYQCGCRNIHFKDIHLQKKREFALSIHFDHDKYSRSVYPGAKMPVQQNLVFENLIVENEVDSLVRSITPVDSVKILNSVVDNNRIQLETLPETEEAYGETQVLLSGNTFTSEGKTELVRCEEGRSCSLTTVGNMTLHQSFEPYVTGNVKMRG